MLKVIKEICHVQACLARLLTFVEPMSNVDVDAGAELGQLLEEAVVHAAKALGQTSVVIDRATEEEQNDYGVIVDPGYLEELERRSQSLAEAVVDQGETGSVEEWLNQRVNDLGLEEISMPVGAAMAMADQEDMPVEEAMAMADRPIYDGASLFNLDLKNIR